MGCSVFAISVWFCVTNSALVSFIVLLFDVVTALGDVVSIKSLELWRSYDDESGCWKTLLEFVVFEL